MDRIPQEPAREHLIDMEAIVDCYAELREGYRQLPALLDELDKAGL
ncbi:MAG: hypothetical protein AAGG50_07280 [Bacteroidota bacterium]